MRTPMPEFWVAGFSGLGGPGAERLGFLPIQRFTRFVVHAGPHQPTRFDVRREPR